MLELTTGGVVTSGKGSLDINAFYRVDAKAKEAPLYMAEKDPQSGIPKTDKIIEVVPSCNPRFKKFWSTRRHEYPNGSYIKLVFKRTGMGGSFGASMCAVMLGLRETGPLNQLEVELPFSDGCSKSKLYMVGRYDYLTPEQIEERGLNFNAAGVDEFDMFERAADEDYITLRVLEKERLPTVKVKMVQRSGETKTVPKIRRGRRIVIAD